METMEDDIDIEEHDVMDNPRIRDMFPDLDIVKEEPQDLSDQESYSEHNFQNVLHYEESDNGDDLPSNYDINADALPYESHLPESAQNYCDIYTGQSNVIILGTKPPSEPILKEKLPAFVVLEDWSEILKRNPCFCKDCGTLFPTENVLHAHKMSSHSFLVAISNSVAKKSTSLPFFNPKHQGELCDVKTNKCNHCNTFFPDGTSLIKHLYELLPSKQIINTSTPSVTVPKAMKKVVELQSRKYFKCILCRQIFEGKNRAKRHRDEKHPEMGRRRLFEVNFKSFNTNQTAKRVEGPDIKPHNLPVPVPIIVPKPEFKYKCTSCLMWFDSAYSARMHRQTRHPEKRGQNLMKKYICKAKPEKICKPKALNKITDNSEMATAKLYTMAPKMREFVYQFSKGLLIKNPPIPVSLLHRCLQCNIHFVVGYSAINHFKQCRRSTPYEVCNICKRMIAKKDIDMHKFQHVFSDKFRIFTNIDWIFYRKMLCCCPKCNVYFTEYRFWNHYVKHPETLETRDCKTCNIVVNKPCYTIHQKYHRIYKTKRKDMVLIEFKKFDDVGTKRKSSALDLPSKKMKLHQSIEASDNNFRLYYCSLCNCCSYRISNNDCHFRKTCQDRLKKRCDLCGLSFLNKGLRVHKKWHDRNTLILSNIYFQTHDGEQTLPEPPSFEKCEGCNVHYDKTHFCADDSYACRDCQKRFTADAYKLHIPFHELKKYYEKKEIPKMWNIIYYCDVCEFSVDSYDRAVAHSQNHLFDENMNQLCEKCEICDLNLHFDCINKHKNLHENMNLNKTDFLILQFDYKKLLHDKWLELFRRLPQTTVQEIIKKSLHSVHRDVKLRLKQDGTPDYTIYFCHVCELCISTPMVSKHAYKNCRKNERKYHCDKCSLYFDTNENFNKHTREHDSTNEFRIIEFKYEETETATEVKEELVHEDAERVFYQCSNCKIAIKTHTWRHRCTEANVKMCKICGLYFYSHKEYRHNRFHTQNPELNKFNVIIRPFTNDRKPIKKENEKIVHCKVYRCLCNLHYMTLDSAKKHVKRCNQDETSSKNCDICGLLFPTKDLSNHLAKQHKSQSNIQVENIPTLNVYECDTCHLVFNKRYEHSKHNCGDEGQVCDICKLKFHSDSLQFHLSKHEDNSCGFFFNNIVKLRSKKLDTSKTVKVEESEEASCSSIVESSESTANSELEVTNVDSPSANKYKFKLHKCSECDVYFTNQSSCQKHMNKHEKLSDLEFIECKLCGLQFLVVQLHNHLKNHHKTPVRLEDIRIEEHKVDAASNKTTEVYCAVDRIQFKTVSSTKIEQQIKTEPE